MDAKPIRGFRVHGDENAIPAAAVNKSLHSRNKSSPALSSTVAVGAIKLATKRTAFGDVSNTSNASQPAKDDSVLPVKIGWEYNTKEQGILQQNLDNKASAALSKPAHRPFSFAAGFKNTLNGSTTNVAPAAKPVSQLTGVITQPANKYKALLGKRSTTGIKDPSAPLQPLFDAVDLSKPLPVYHDLSPHLQQAPETRTNSVARPQVRKAQSSYSFATARPEPETSIANHVPSHTAITKFDSNHDFAQGMGLKTGVHSGEVDSNVQPAMPHFNAAISQSTEASETHGHCETHSSADPALLGHSEMPTKAPFTTGQEPEEYWEEDEEAENYEEEGYVTARSFKSRGENITGNATTTLVPKASLKAQKEIAAAKELVESMKTEDEIEDEAWDTSMVAEYGEEIFEYMRTLEIKMQPNPHYMDHQTEIQWSMRSVLMDWLVQVHLRFQLLPETLFLCVNYIDRFLTCKVVSLGKLQLVGATAIFVAAKYEEINCPSVSEIVYMVDSGYTTDEILKAERFMLSMLQFELGYPGPMSFLRRISKADDYDLETRTLAKYVLEVTIMDERFLGCPPSFTAAGAHCLARIMLKKGNWSPAHVYYSNYTYAQLLPLVQLMFECCEDPTKHHAAIYDKYQDKRYKCASRFVHNEIRKGFQVPDVSTNNAQTFMNFYDTSLWNSERHRYC